MSKINELQCWNTSGNLGRPTCAGNPGIIRGAFLIPKNSFLTATQLLTPQATINGLLHHNTYANRWQYIGELGKPVNKGKQPATESLDEYERTVSKGTWKYMYQLIDGNVGYMKSLTLFDRKEAQYDTLLVDENNALIGTQKIDPATNLNALGGLSLFELKMMPWEQQTVTSFVNYGLSIALQDINQINKYFAWVQNLGYNVITDAPSQGVVDATLFNISPVGAAAGVFTLSVSVGNGDIDLVALYSAILSTAGNWVIKNVDTGAAIVPTGVAVNATGNGITFTLNTGGGTYPAVGHGISFNFASVSTLATAGMSYYETTPLIVAAT